MSGRQPAHAVLLIESYGMEPDPHGSEPRIGPVVIAGTGPEVLFEILRPGVAMAVWGRAMMPGASAAFATSPLPAFEAAAEDGFEQVAASLLGKAPCALPEVLRIDIDSLAAMFAVVAVTGTVRARLRHVRAGPDAPFTAEPARLRLLCAYGGAGIDWRPACGVLPGRLDVFSAAIVKGNAFSGDHGRGSLHRPAAVSGADQGCLVLDLEAA